MLSLALLPYPEIDPVLVELGPLVIRWYALAYIAGILLGYGWIKRLNRQAALLSPKQLEDMIVWAIIGILLGGRLGYVVFYQPAYYLAHPEDILAIWQGGMAFHGGMLGVLLAFWLFARRHRLPYLPLMDLVACAAPIGLFFGRLANFINGELYGRQSDVPWAMIFPGSDGLPRHPSQLYEAALEGLLLFGLLALLATRTGAPHYPGLLGGVFLAGYGAARAFAELFREPDAHLGLLWLDLTMGQILSLPMIILGLGLILTAKNRKMAV